MYMICRRAHGVVVVVVFVKVKSSEVPRPAFFANSILNTQYSQLSFPIYDISLSTVHSVIPVDWLTSVNSVKSTNDEPGRHAGTFATMTTASLPAANPPFTPLDASRSSGGLDRLQTRPNLRVEALPLEISSPVNQRGHFEFDRVIRAGEAQKRTRKTKSWRTVYLVLRPGSLSIYRNPNETKLRHKIALSDLTAVARQRDPKGKAKHVFGLFLPSRNYHLAAENDQEAQGWVEDIRREARIDEAEGDMALASPGGIGQGTYTGFERAEAPPRTRQGTIDSLAFSSSDAENHDMSPVGSLPRTQTDLSGRRPSTALEYSGPENASYSDFSELAGPTSRLSYLSVSRQQPASTIQRTRAEFPERPDAAVVEEDASDNRRQLEEEEARASVAQMQAAARVVCQDWMLLLKTHSGVKQWKKVWMVLRAPALAIYKDEKEYSAMKVIPLSDIVDAVEVDPISSSKRFCLQIITEDKSYRFCAPDDDKLAAWLGSFKSLLRRRNRTESIQ